MGDQLSRLSTNGYFLFVRSPPTYPPHPPLHRKGVRVADLFSPLLTFRCVSGSGDVATLLEQVRSSARILSELSGPAGAVGPELVRVIEAARQEVERRLSGGDLLVAVASETPAVKRAFLNALVGARAFDPEVTHEGETVIEVRSAATIDYEARLKDGTTIAFSVRMTDRGESFARARSRAEEEMSEAESAERRLRARVDHAERETIERTAPRKVSPARRASGPSRLWQWLVSALLALFGRSRATPPALPSGEPTPDEEDAEAAAISKQSLAEARARVEQAAARIELVRLESVRYEQERAESYVRDLRELSDANARGADVVRLLVACPTPYLASGVALVDAAEPPVDADGCIVIAGDDPPSPELLSRLARALLPAKPHVVRKPAELPAVLDRVQAARPIVAGVRVAAALRRCIAHVADEGARTEAICEKRIAALEAQRIPQPAEFRARQMLRMRKAVDDAARDVEQATLRRWQAHIARTKEDWRAGVEACADRKTMEAFVRTINQNAPAHLQELVEDAGRHAITELQRASETLQEWFLQEIHARYQVTRRIEEGDAPVAVVGEALDVAPLGRAPLESAVDRFERGRVGLGLGGVAAGAAVGTIIVPGIGTAIGAFVGVLAGFLRGLDSLKKECSTRLDTCLDDVERSVTAQIVGRQASLAEALRASLDEAFEHALARLEESIARLMALERRVLETERTRRSDLSKLRSILEEHAARFEPSALPASG
jgi:hypothetical protein